MVAWIHCFRAGGKAQYHVRECKVEQICLPHWNWEAKREGKRGQGLDTPFESVSPVTFLLLVLT
jgi:hypothetical protein